MELMEEQVKEGFKKTEIGIIPEDWSLKRLGNFVRITSGESPSKFIMQDHGIPYYKVEQLNNSLKYTSQTPYYISPRYEKSIEAKSLVFPKRGASILQNKIRILSEKAFIDTNLMALTLIDEVNSELIYYLISYFGLDKIADTTSIPQINNKHIKPYPFPLPPTLSEQKAIAEALSDVDAMISKLDTLIEKKKAIKQGAMQQLLTPPHKGGKRLPGFDGEWEEKTLGEVSDVSTGSKNNQDKVDGGKYPFFVRSQNVERINSYSFDREAILVPGEGGIGTIFHYINGKFEVHQRVYMISNFNSDYFGRFIYLKMTLEFYNHAMTNSVKATVDSLRKPTFLKFVIDFPPSIEEQIQITNVIFDIKNDIQKLINEKSKYLKIKKGMMQELLTGKTRLI